MKHDGRNIKHIPASIARVILFILFCCSLAAAQSWPLSACGAEEVQLELTLDDAVRMAGEHSYRIRAAQMDLDGARQDRRAAAADFLPKVNANYDYTNLGEQPVSISDGAEIPTAHREQYHWDVTVIQPLFTGFALKSQYETAQLNTRVKALEQKQVSLDITRDAKTTYFRVLLAGKILDVREQTVESFKAQEEDSRKFFEQELIPYNDLLRYQVALANARQERERAAASAKLWETRLNLLLGLPRGTVFKLEDVESFPKPELDLESLVSLSLEDRPILLSGRLGLAVLEKAVTAAKSEYYPKLSAFALYEHNGDNPAADSNDYSNDHNSAVGFQMNWNVFEWGKTRALVSKSRLDLKAAKQRLLELEDGVRFEVEQAYRDVLVAEQNIGTAEQALEQAKENWRITRMQYREQVATSTDVLDARAFLTQADTNYYQALYGYMIALAELERAVGTEVGNENAAM